MKDIKTLQDFYALMRSTIEVRRSLVARYLKGESIAADLIDPLKHSLQSLRAIPLEAAGYRLRLDASRDIHLDLSYEINELHKDILFLEQGEEEFSAYIKELHPGLADEVEAGMAALRGIHFQAFITDRDGTVNNYCGRYASSVQSVYNAIYLTRFASRCADGSVILTSAPLDNIGLVDIAVGPENVFTYAGSKGREYFSTGGERRQFPIEADKQAKLSELNDALGFLLMEPEFEMYGLIGSGLQYKFGQTTVARQDITGSIPPEQSKDFLEHIESMVTSLDPSHEYFRIEDTGLDIEIILTIESEGEKAKDFDKGDGVRYLDEDIGLGMAQGPSLICGDTNSDVPMLTTSLEIAPDTYSVFVTQKDALREKVRSLCPNAVLVSEPDALITILNNLALESGR